MKMLAALASKIEVVTPLSPLKVTTEGNAIPPVTAGSDAVMNPLRAPAAK
jgi:hypothetical protein